MDEKTPLTKADNTVTRFSLITVSALILTNASFVFTRQKKFSAFMPLSIMLCAVTAALSIIVIVLLIINFKKLTRKKHSVVSCVFITLLCALECYMGVSAVKDMNDKRDAENRAALFIKDKYGLTAEARYKKSYLLTDKSRRLTTVEMSADSRDFIVEILTDNADGTAIFADSYQAEEIGRAVFDEVSRVYPNGILCGVGVYSRAFLGDTVVEKYFDGTNLDEVLDGQRGGIKVEFADTKFDLDAPLFEKLSRWGVQPYFTSFDTAAHLEEFTGGEKLGSVYGYDEHYAKYAPYITDRVAYEWDKADEKGKVIRKSCGIMSNGEFDYALRDIAENEEGAEKMEKRFAKYSDTALGKPVTKVYEREFSGNSSFFIFYSLEKLNGTSVENIEAAWISDSAGSNNAFGAQKAEIIGDYALFVLPYYVEEFMIVDTGGTDGGSRS